MTAAGEFSKTAVAFLTGLGVRVVYGAFERTIEILGEKMNLGRVRIARQAPDDVSNVLTKKLANINPNQEPDKYRAIVEILREMSTDKEVGVEEDKSDETKS